MLDNNRSARASIVLLATAICAAVIATELIPAARVVMDGVVLRATAAFAVSRGINAALSFVQEISVEGSLVIFGGAFKPLSFLDPINNLVDQFAQTMLLVAAVALVSDFLLRIGEAFGLWVLLPISLLLFGAELACAHYKPAQLLALRRFSRAAVLGIVSIAVLLPGAVVATDSSPTGSSPPPISKRRRRCRSWRSRRRNWRTRTRGGSSALADGASEIVGGWKVSFADLFESVVTLIAIFALETVLLPWLSYGCSFASARVWPTRNLAEPSLLSGCRAAVPWSGRCAGT